MTVAITSITRSIVTDTIVNKVAYTSGQLNVSDLRELSLDINVTADNNLNGVFFTVSRVGTDGIVYWMLSTLTTTIGVLSRSICASLGYSFGDYIQIDMVNTKGDVISATVSLKGKP